MKILLNLIAGSLLLTSLHAEDSPPTPAQQKIAAAEKALEAKPEAAALYPPLAFAYAARARETADGENYSKGMAAVRKALELEPNNFDALKAEAWILLGQHEFQKALIKTRALNERSGDDPIVYAMRTDAAMETGNFDEAEEAAQWALDMDAGGVPGLTRAADLREHLGDFDGALELLQKAFARTLETETEERAWLFTRLGHLLLLKNQPEAAEKVHLEALKIFPGYHYALLNLAEVKTAQGKKDEALEFHRLHYAAAPHPENLYPLAKAMKAAGKDEEAKKAFADFEKAALGVSQNVDNANRELVAYYVDHAKKPKEALRIAEIEMGNRTDFRTRDAYAWALHADGQNEKAHEVMTKALEVGVKYPVMQYHAGIIARDAGDKEAARKFLESSLAQGPGSEVAGDAKEALGDL